MPITAPFARVTRARERQYRGRVWVPKTTWAPHFPAGFNSTVLPVLCSRNAPIAWLTRAGKQRYLSLVTVWGPPPGFPFCPLTLGVRPLSGKDTPKVLSTPIYPPPPHNYSSSKESKFYPTQSNKIDHCDMDVDMT